MKPLDYIILFFIIMVAVYVAIMWNEKVREKKLLEQQYLAYQQQAQNQTV